MAAAAVQATSRCVPVPVCVCVSSVYVVGVASGAVVITFFECVERGRAECCTAVNTLHIAGAYVGGGGRCLVAGGVFEP